MGASESVTAGSTGWSRAVSVLEGARGLSTGHPLLLRTAWSLVALLALGLPSRVDAQTSETPNFTIEYHHADLSGNIRLTTDECGAVVRAAIGRFQTVDPVLHVDRALRDPQPWNRYAYARNNPLIYTDPDGRSATAIGMATGAVVGGVIAVFQRTDIGAGFVSGGVSGAIVDSVVDSVGGTLAELAAGGFGGSTGRLIRDAMTGHQTTLGETAGAFAGGMAGAGLGMAVGKAMSTLTTDVARGEALKTTAHGAERIAGAAATRDRVLSEGGVAAVREGGRVLTQADGATVRFLQNASGRFNVVLEGERGIITAFENLSHKSLDWLGRNYGWR